MISSKPVETWEGEGGATLEQLRLGSVTDAIRVGSILIQQGAPLPKAALLRVDPYLSGWAAVTEDRAAFEKEAQEAGLTFFFMAGEIKARVYGFDREKSLRRAVSRLIAEVKNQNCNCIEITRITDNRFLRIPSVSVYAHARHVQKGFAFSGSRR